MRATAWVLVAFGFFNCIQALAGKTTVAEIGLNFLGDLRINNALGALFGAGGLAWGTVERTLRKRTVKRLSSRIKDLETAIDPNRSSSKLTDKGGTRKEDR
jgi:hypothetical protein